jgi:uncharacterized protein (DUF1778 family)
MPARSERLEARVTPEQKQLFERAAALHGRSVSEFVVSVAQDAAMRTIHEHDVLYLSVRDSRAFVESLLDPQGPTENLRRAAAAYKEFVRE